MMNSVGQYQANVAIPSLFHSRAYPPDRCVFVCVCVCVCVCAVSYTHLTLPTMAVV